MTNGYYLKHSQLLCSLKESIYSSACVSSSAYSEAANQLSPSSSNSSHIRVATLSLFFLSSLPLTRYFLPFFPSLSLLGTTILSSVIVNFAFFFLSDSTYMCIHAVFVFVWLILLCKMSSHSSMLLQMVGFFIFLWLIFLCVYKSFFLIHAFVSEHLLFPSLDCCEIGCRDHGCVDISSRPVYPEASLPDGMLVLFLLFWGFSILLPIMTVPIYILTKSVQRFPFLCFLTKTCLTLVITIPNRMKWCLAVPLCFLVTSDAQHLFTYLLAICTTSSEKCLLGSLAIFLNWEFYLFLLSSCTNPLYFLDINLSNRGLEIFFLS